MKNKSDMTISIDINKAFEKIQHHFWYLHKIVMEGAFYNTIKAMYEKPSASIILSDGRLEAFPLKYGTRQGHSISPLLFNIVLIVQSSLELLGKEKKLKKVKLKMRR